MLNSKLNKIAEFFSGAYKKINKLREGKEKDRTEIEKIKDIVKKVDGWISDEEGKALYNITKNGPGEGVIVEIGSFKGKSTIWLTSGTKAARREKVYSIDLHKHDYSKWKGMAPDGTCGGVFIYKEHKNTEKIFRKNLKKAGVDDWVVPIVLKSEKAVKKWNRPIRLLWIDGSHEYRNVKKDFLLWEPYVIDGGTIAMHDTFPGFPISSISKEDIVRQPQCVGPTKVLERYVKNSQRFKIFNYIGLTTFIKKLKKQS